MVFVSKVTALGSLYQQWPTLKPELPRVPPHDVTLDMSYVRLRSNVSTSSGNVTKAPFRILAFHGSPGCASDFDSFARALGQKANIDFIAPTFPGSKNRREVPFGYLAK